MAFHQPTRQSIQRVVRPSVDEQELPRREAPITQERQQDESQTWVLFAPTDVTTTSYLTETDQSLVTPGRSRVGDLGSLNSVSRSEVEAELRPSASASAVAEEEDDAELDSLDSHLPEFRSLPGLNAQQDENQGSMPVFPAHDGLGSFHLDQPTVDRFNPAMAGGELDSSTRSLLNSWLADYARREPIYKIDPTIARVMGALQVQSVGIENGRIAVTFNQGLGNLVPQGLLGK